MYFWPDAGAANTAGAAGAVGGGASGGASGGAGGGAGGAGGGAACIGVAGAAAFGRGVRVGRCGPLSEVCKCAL